MAPRQEFDFVEEFVLLGAIDAESIGRALAVHVDECAANHDIQQLGGSILAQLAEALRGEDARESAFPPACGKSDHRLGRLRFSRALFWAKDVSLIHDYHAWMPEIFRRIDHGVDEFRDPFMAHRWLHLVQVADRRCLQFQQFMCDERSASRIRWRLPALTNKHIAVLLAQCGELAFGVDDDDLNFAEKKLRDSTQKMRFALAAVCLHE